MTSSYSNAATAKVRRSWPLCRRTPADGGHRRRWPRSSLRQVIAKVVVHVEVFPAIRSGGRLFDILLAAVAEGNDARVRSQRNDAHARTVEPLDDDLRAIPVNGKVEAR